MKVEAIFLTTVMALVVIAMIYFIGAWINYPK